MRVFQPTITGSLTVTGSMTLNGQSVATTLDRRHDFVYPFSYCGKAVAGSSEAASVWTITRLNTSGSVDTIASASNVAWTNRYSVTYS